MRNVNPWFGIIIGLVLILASAGLIIALIYQKKQEKKYKNCLKIIKEKGNKKFSNKTELTEEELNKVDPDVDMGKLMNDLFQKYLEFQKKFNEKVSDFDNLLSDGMKIKYTNMLSLDENMKTHTIIDKIDLINYSIVSFDKEFLEFRVTIDCVKYKMRDDEIISGNNLNKIEIVNIINFIKKQDDWLIDDIDEVYEKKLSD